jgi:hypothetical protein
MLKNTAVDAEMPEEKILGRRRFLNEEISFAVPEHRIGSGPTDIDIFPEPCGERRLDVVVEIARRPLFVRLAG